MKARIIEEGDEVTIKLTNVRTPRYINQFIRKHCAIDLLQLNMFPDAKEITETLGVFNAIKKDYATQFKYDDVLLVDVACGGTPRIAAWTVFNTKWKAIAIDPNLRSPENFATIQNLETFTARIEDKGFTHLDRKWYPKEVVIVANHAHVSLDCIVKGLKNHIIDDTGMGFQNWSLYAVPCCQPLELSSELGSLVYECEDHDIWSPKRLIKKYKVF